MHDNDKHDVFAVARGKVTWMQDIRLGTGRETLKEISDSNTGMFSHKLCRTIYICITFLILMIVDTDDSVLICFLNGKS